MNTVDRINSVAIDSTLELIDSTYQAQLRSAELTKSWLNSIESSQQATREHSRDLATKLMKQAQEVQSLWMQLGQDAFRNGLETVAKASQSQLKEVSDRFETVSRQANNTGKRTETAAK